MYHHLYTGLIAEYRSHEFGIAITSIIDFFVDDCKKHLNKVRDEYKKRYEDEFNVKKNKKLEKNKTLHFQRRLMSQWYWQLKNCVSKCSFPFPAYKVSQNQFNSDFPNNEANLLKIIIEMNEEVENNDKIYKNIETDEKISGDRSGINKHIIGLYKMFEKRKPK
jgi:hypothetical protein